MVKLYKKAQNRLMLMKVFPRCSKFTKATILYKFSESMIISAALMFSYDLALMDIPIEAYWRQGISLRPSPTIMTPIPLSSSKSFWTSLIHYIFINALCSGCRYELGRPRAFPSCYTLSLESPERMWTCLCFFIKSSTIFFASGLKLECVLMTITCI